jgi:hypothetical protein
MMSDPIDKVTEMAEELQETQPESSTAELFSAIANALKHWPKRLMRLALGSRKRSRKPKRPLAIRR